MTQLQSFQDILPQIGDKATLLLGNGFSMAYDKDRFSFTSLLDSAVKDEIIEKDGKIHQIFQLLNTADFESVMRLFEQSKIVLDVYEGGEGIRQEIISDASNLKDYLVKVITNNHPAKSIDVDADKKIACASFLKLFESIYTLNYDLLLYWAIMQDDEATKKFTDNFGEDEDSISEGYVVYQNSSHKSNIFFLHGALHLFDAGDRIIKETYSKTDITLMEQTKANLDKGIYPIFVSEGESSQKMTKILHSAYLNSSYKSLKNKTGTLVILGTYLKQNDEHILNAIMDSRIESIYIGVSSENSIDHITSTIEAHNRKAEEYNQTLTDRRKQKAIIKKIHLYDYRTINPREYTTS